MKRERLIALVDQDGVLTNHDEGLRVPLRLMISSGEPLYLPPFMGEDLPDWMWKRIEIIKNQKDWWKKLKPLKRGFDLLDEIKKYGFETHILTKALSKSFNAYSEKAEWIEDHVGRIGKDVIMHISGDKSGNYGRILVDDWPGYIKDWLEFRERGLVIMPNHKYNKDFRNPRVLRYVDKRDMWRVREVLRWARDRKGLMPKFK